MTSTLRFLSARQSTLTALAALAVWLLSSCGSWAGNPGGGDDDDDGPVDGEQKIPVSIGQGDSGPGKIKLKKGEVMQQKIKAYGGSELKASLNLTYDGMALRQALTSESEEGPKTPLEISVVKAKDGSEAAYDRDSLSDAQISTQGTDTDYLLIVKSNADTDLTIEDMTLEGGQKEGNAIAAKSRPETPEAQTLIKGVVAVARYCQLPDENGNTQNHSAPEGQAYIQPFVFLGQVDADGRVAARPKASIKLHAGGTTITLKPLESIATDKYRSEYGGPTDASQYAYTLAFYQAYFGGAGTLYTVDAFAKGYCQDALTIPIPESDVGKNPLQLVVDDAEGLPAISLVMDLRLSVAPSFSTYLKPGERISDWTQCTYDRRTGQPMTYNGDAAACKEFSLEAPPFVSLDYKLPSATNAGLSSISDPTRMVFYGHSYSNSWFTSLVANHQSLKSASSRLVTMDSCLTNGGLVSIPLSESRAYLPLHEFNAAVGDVINLARRSGSYTALPNFYQGNVDLSGDLEVHTCLPDGTSACPEYGAVTVRMRSCSGKADSGIATLSLSDAMIYPSYFEMSGIIRP